MNWSSNDVDRIASYLLDGSRESLSRENLPNEFRTGELLYDVQSYNYSLRWQMERWGKILCVVSKETEWSPILIDVRNIRFHDWPFYRASPIVDRSYRYFKDFLEDMNLNVIQVSNLEAVNEYFKSNFTAFINTRIKSFSDDKNSSVMQKNELPFVVHTQGINLRVLYSPAYLFGGGYVFGYPSTPVNDFLKPGSYIFGAEGIGGIPVWEPNRIYHVPNDTHATLFAI